MGGPRDQGPLAELVPSRHAGHFGEGCLPMTPSDLPSGTQAERPPGTPTSVPMTAFGLLRDRSAAQIGNLTPQDWRCAPRFAIVFFLPDAARGLTCRRARKYIEILEDLLASSHE